MNGIELKRKYIAHIDWGIWDQNEGKTICSAEKVQDRDLVVLGKGEKQ